MKAKLISIAKMNGRMERVAASMEALLTKQAVNRQHPTGGRLMLMTDTSRP